MEHYRAHLLWIGHKDCASGVTLSPIKLTSINFEYNRIVSAEIKAIYIVISFEVSTHKRLLPNGWQLRTQTSDEQPTRLAKMQSIHRSNTPLALDTWTISTISTLYLEYLGKKQNKKEAKCDILLSLSLTLMKQTSAESIISPDITCLKRQLEALGQSFFWANHIGPFIDWVN